MFVSRTQPTKSSSIAEAELLAITAGVAGANLVQSIVTELDQDVKIRILSNATATFEATDAIARRHGFGRFR